jgi:hypothetical protein
MTARVRSVALPILIGLALLLGPSIAAGQAPPRAERPTYAVGDRWIRNDGLYDLIRVEKDVYVFAAEGGRIIHLTKDLVVSYFSRRDNVEWIMDPAPRLPWPLEVGKWGRQSINKPGAWYDSQVTWRVDAFEDVKVPAGTIKAFRISFHFNAGNVTLWYSPVAKQLVRGASSLRHSPYVSGALLNFPAFQVVAVDGFVPVPAVAIAPKKVPSPAAARPSPSVPSREGVELLITSPADQTRLEREHVALAGVVSSVSGIARVTVSLNGVEVTRVQEPVPARSVPLDMALKLLEGSNTVLVTVVAGDGTVHQTMRTVHYERSAPLTVSIRYPSEGTRVSEESSVVAAVVAASKGVTRVTVTLNGVAVHEQQERTPVKSLIVTVPVKFKEGANTVVVAAAAPDGQTVQELRALVFERPAEIASSAPPTPKPPPARDRWAVVIGVGRYENDGIPRLTYAVPDAEAIYQTLVGPGGFKKENVLLLTDRTERKPTLRSIRWALGTFLSRSARKDDTVLIFFAGHGAPEVDPRGLERDGLAKYLIPIDADPDDLYSSAFPMDELQTVFARIEAERVVAFLDACYSGTAGGRTFTSRKTRSGSVDDLFLERLTRSRGRAIITASRPSEVSLELAELGHGVFTYFLLQGLKGAGDLNRDGIVSLQELYEYVEQQVVGKSRAVGGNQHPVMRGELEGALPLMRVTPRRP